MSGLNTLAEGTGKLLESMADNAEIVKDIYDKGIAPTVEEAGRVLSFPLELVNALLVKPRCWIANANYNLKETNILIAKKLERIEKEKIVSPEDYIAVPALQSLSYSMDYEELRNLYANLLAKSMNTDTKDYIHPAFVEIIRQLSPLDVQIFNHIFESISKNTSNYFNLYDVTVVDISRKDETEYIGVFDYSDYDLHTITSSIENLTRCKLICEDANTVFQGSNVRDEETVKKWGCIKNPSNSNLKYRITFIRHIHISEFGKSFHFICCSDD